MSNSVEQAEQAWDARIAWYRSPVDKETLRHLTERSDARGLLQMLSHLGLTVATGALVWYAWFHLPWPFLIPALFAHGTFYAFLSPAAAGHELSHGTVFKSHWLNAFFVRLVGFLTWTNFVWFRTSHTKHHALTVHTRRDLEVVLPATLTWRDWLYSFTAYAPGIFYAVKGMVRIAANRLETEWEHRLFPEPDSPTRRQMVNWARFLLAGHTLLAAVFIWFHLWPLLLTITFGSFYAGWLAFLCGATQHAGMQPDVPDFRRCCRTLRLHPVVAFLYWQMNHHIEHHMYAAVPFYKLPQLRAAIEQDLPIADRLIPAWRRILAIQKQRETDPTCVEIPRFPPTAQSVNLPLSKPFTTHIHHNLGEGGQEGKRKHLRLPPCDHQ